MLNKVTDKEIVEVLEKVLSTLKKILKDYPEDKDLQIEITVVERQLKRFN